MLDGEDITPLPTHKRNLGMVFQSLALFPHLSVGDNIAYALRIRGASKEEQKKRVDELLSLIHLPGFADRPVAKLSGGQRQRVAIARALALSPKLFLLDEPLSALDAKLREAMQVELRQLQQRLGITTIVVTHDQREAMTMADLVVVMGHGRIRQAAPPIEIYRKPADAFVADFIGIDQSAAGGSRQRRRARTILGTAIPGLAMPAGRARPRCRSGPRTCISARPAARQSPARSVSCATSAAPSRPSSRSAAPASSPSRRRASGRRAGRREGRRHAAARKLRGARLMRREAPKSVADDTPLFFPALMLIVFFVVPFATMIAVSFFQRDPAGFYTPDFVFDNYARFLSVFFGGVLGFSLMLAVLVAVCCVAIGFPFTYLLTRRPRRVQTLAGRPAVGPVAVGGHHRLCLVDAVLAHRRHHQSVRRRSG